MEITAYIVSLTTKLLSFFSLMTPDIHAAICYLLAGFVRAIVDGKEFRAILIVLILCIPVGIMSFDLSSYLTSNEDIRNVIAVCSAFTAKEIAEGVITFAKYVKKNPSKFIGRK